MPIHSVTPSGSSLWPPLTNGSRHSSFGRLQDKAWLEASTESVVLAKSAVQKDLRQMRTELWKGDICAVSRATRAVRPNLRSFRDKPHAPARKKRVRKLKALMKKPDKYVRNPDAQIVDYCARKTEGKSLGTALVEGAAEFIVNARMAKSQHMR